MTSTKCRATAKGLFGRIPCVLEIFHDGDHEDANHIKWKNRGRRGPAAGVCGATPRGGDGTAVCVLQPRHGVLHQDQMGGAFKLSAKPSAPRYGLVIKVTEWKELRRRVERACEDRPGDPIPDKPDWPPGSTGANLQKLRRLVNQLNARFERKE